MSRQIHIHVDCTRDEIVFQLGHKYAEASRHMNQMIIVVDSVEKLPKLLITLSEREGRPKDLVICQGVTSVLDKAREMREQFTGPEIPNIHVVYWLPQIIKPDGFMGQGALPISIGSDTVMAQISSDEINKVTIFMEKV